MQDVLTVKEMRTSDENTIKSGISSIELMERAGRAVAEEIKRRGLLPVRNLKEYGEPGKIAIIAGKGGNGGDGCVIARELHKEGYDVTLYIIENNFSDAALWHFNKCKECGVNIAPFTANTSLARYDLIFDCIFGTGFKGEPRDSEKKLYNSAINAINENGAYRVSVDINSGLSGDNGCAVNAVRSELTVSIEALKPGLFLNDAKDYIGELTCVSIGIQKEEARIFLTEGKDFSGIVSKRRNASTKADYGYICLIAGSFNYSGAAKMSYLSLLSTYENANQTEERDKREIYDSRFNGKRASELEDLSLILEAAGRSGAGVVTLATPESTAYAVSPYILESTLFPLSDNNGTLAFNEEEFRFLCSKYKTIGFGMGLGNTGEVQKALSYMLDNYAGTLLIDADGINALSVIGKEHLKNAKCRIILTPHTAEFSRLVKKDKAEIMQNPIQLAKDFACEYGIILLLKGPSTIVTDGEKTYIVTRGCPGMASAGSGDVLSGIITALLGSSKEDTLLTVSAAAYIAGLSGEFASREKGEISMLARDTVLNIPNAFFHLSKECEEDKDAE